MFRIHPRKRNKKQICIPEHTETLYHESSQVGLSAFLYGYRGIGNQTVIQVRYSYLLGTYLLPATADTAPVRALVFSERKSVKVFYTVNSVG